jgi:hypothetical protein
MVVTEKPKLPHGTKNLRKRFVVAVARDDGSLRLHVFKDKVKAVAWVKEAIGGATKATRVKLYPPGRFKDAAEMLDLLGHAPNPLIRLWPTSVEVVRGTGPTPPKPKFALGQKVFSNQSIRVRLAGSKKLSCLRGTPWQVVAVHEPPEGTREAFRYDLTCQGVTARRITQGRLFAAGR